MKYFNTLVEEQETLINVLYDEQTIRIYTNKIEIIQNLINKLGQPTTKYRKSKTYWSGASWDIDFKNLDKIKGILNKEIIIDDNFVIKEKIIKKKSNKDSSKQCSFL